MLKKLPSVLLALVLTASIASAFQQPAGWITFTSAEGKFSILLTEQPKVQVQEVDSKVGKLTLYSYSSSSRLGYLMVSYGDYPTEPTDASQIEKVLDAVRDGVLSSIGEKLSDTKIVLKGRSIAGTADSEYPGRAFSSKKTIEGSEVIFTWRIFLVGRRLYQVAAATNKADAASPDIQKFLSSFQLTN